MYPFFPPRKREKRVALSQLQVDPLTDSARDPVGIAVLIRQGKTPSQKQLTVCMQAGCEEKEGRSIKNAYYESKRKILLKGRIKKKQPKISAKCSEEYTLCFLQITVSFTYKPAVNVNDLF